MAVIDWSHIKAISYSFQAEPTSKYAKSQQHFARFHQNQLSGSAIEDMFTTQDDVKGLLPEAITNIRVKICDQFLEAINIGDEEQRERMKDHIIVLLADTTIKGNTYGRPSSIRDNGKLNDMAEDAKLRNERAIHLELNISKWQFRKSWQQHKFLKIYIENHETPSDDEEDTPKKERKRTRDERLDAIQESQEQLRRYLRSLGIAVTPKKERKRTKTKIRPLPPKPKIVPPSGLHPEIIPPCELKPASAQPSEPLVSHHEERNRATQANAGNPETSSDNKNAIVAPKQIIKIDNSPVQSSQTEFVPSTFDNLLSFPLSPDSGSGGVVVPHGTDNPKQEERKEQKQKPKERKQRQFVTNTTSNAKDTDIRTSVVNLAGDNVDHNPDLCTFIANDTNIRTSVAADCNLRTYASDSFLRSPIASNTDICGPVVNGLTERDIRPSIANQHPDLRTYSGSVTNTDFLRIPNDKDIESVANDNATDILNPRTYASDPLPGMYATTIHPEILQPHKHPDLRTYSGSDTNTDSLRTSVPSNTDICGHIADPDLFTNNHKNERIFVPYILVPLLPPSEPPPMFLSCVHSFFQRTMDLFLLLPINRCPFSFLLIPDQGV